MCIKAVDNYSSTIKYVPDWYKTQEMYIGAVNVCSFVFNSVHNQYKTQKCVIKLLMIILMQ